MGERRKKVVRLAHENPTLRTAREIQRSPTTNLLQGLGDWAPLEGRAAETASRIFKIPGGHPIYVFKKKILGKRVFLRDNGLKTLYVIGSDQRAYSAKVRDFTSDLKLLERFVETALSGDLSAYPEDRIYRDYKLASDKRDSIVESDLRRNLIRLARENPSLRPQLLPLLKEATGIAFQPENATERYHTRIPRNLGETHTLRFNSLPIDNGVVQVWMTGPGAFGGVRRTLPPREGRTGDQAWLRSQFWGVVDYMNNLRDTIYKDDVAFQHWTARPHARTSPQGNGGIEWVVTVPTSV